MHLLELFSGTGSVGRAIRARGSGVTSVDLEERFSPTICCDVLELQAEDIPGPVHLLWASPPCTHYSRARSKANTPRDLEGSDRLVRKVLQLAEQLGCPFLFENPDGLLKTREVVRGIPFRLVDYCSYGYMYRKRTAIWTNTDWRPAKPLCRHDCPATVQGDRGRLRHAQHAQQGGRRGGGKRHSLEELYSLPALLCEELAQWAEERIG